MSEEIKNEEVNDSEAINAEEEAKAVAAMVSQAINPVKPKKEKKEKAPREKKEINFKNLGENKQALICFGIIVVDLIIMLVSILALQIPAVSLCLLVLIQTLMAVCLNDEAIWLHGVVLVAELLIGGLIGKLVFTVLLVVVYAVCVGTLLLLKRI